MHGGRIINIQYFEIKNDKKDIQTHRKRLENHDKGINKHCYG